MVFSNAEDTEIKPNFQSQQVLTSTIIRDSSPIYVKKKPVSNIPNLLYHNINGSDNESDLSNSSTSGHFDTDDFVEYQFSKPHYATKESVTLVDHDLNKVEANYLKSQLENNEQDHKQTQKEHSSPPRLSPTKKIKQKELNIQDDSDSDDEWKEIDTQLNYGDIYNIRGEKVDSFIHSQDELTKENSTKPFENSKKATKFQKISNKTTNVGKVVVKAAAGINLGKDEKAEKLREKYQRAHLISKDSTQQAYTRIDEEEQAKKFEKMDKKFDFLFKDENSNLRRLHNASTSELNVTDIDNNLTAKTIDDFINNDNFEEIFDNQGHEENELNPSIQMMSTKSMLNDSQKIAYAALVKLIIVQLTTDLVNVRGTGSTKILKKLSVSHTSFMRWSMNIMNALYEHLDIKNEQEIKMIETLSCHGVETSDLSKTFNSNISIENHLNDEDDREDLKMINVSQTEIKDEKTIEIDVKWTLICDLFLILLESSVYDARSRTLLLHFGSSIGISNIEIYQFERRITDSLEIDEAFEIINNNQTWDESDILMEHKRKQKNTKIVKIALATAAGGLVIGLSAGALAPVIGAGLAAGLTTIGIGGTSGFLAGVGGTAVIATTGTLTGMRAGKNAMQHRVGSVKTFEFIPLHNNRRVNLTITVSGWMSGTMDDVRLPFSTVDQVMGDLYSLLWEPEMLTSMGQTINILANEILTQSIQQILGSTLLITLMSGLQLPMMLSKLGYLLDNPWNNSLDRAWRSGKVLADTLRRKKLGVRPITLVGFSLGARLIYSCLLSLAKSGDFGIVENVYLFGSPIVIHDDEISLARSVVSGRFVNGYMKQDWILGYLFRATSGGLRTIAGLSPIDEAKYNIENFNCSEFVKGHMQYREAMPKLLKEAGWEVLNDQFVEIEQPNTGEEERQRKLLSDFEKAQHSKKKKTWYNKLFGKKNKEWWEMYEEGEKEKKLGNGKEKSKEENSDDDIDDTENDSEESGDTKDNNFDVDALRIEIANIEREAKKIEEKNSKKSKSTTTDKKLETEKNKEEKVDANKISQTTPPLSKDSLRSNFHLTPTSNSNTNSEASLEPKKLRKRQSLIQLVESHDKDRENIPTPNSNTGQLRGFRISSNSNSNPNSNEEGRKPRKPSDNSPKINLHLFQSVKPNNIKPEISEAVIYDDRDTMSDTTTIKENKPTTLADLKNIDYGDYYEQMDDKEHMEILNDDEINQIEQKIKTEQSTRSGFGPVTGINYNDESEFPQDESNIQFSFE